jgi:hypothetical protein
MPRRRLTFVLGTIAGAVVLCSAFVLPRVLGTDAVRNVEAPKTQAKWDYCMLVEHENAEREYISAGATVSGQSWKDLARKLQLETNGDDEQIRLGVLNSLGAKGWELTTHAVGRGPNGEQVNVYTFKGRAVGQ